MIEKQLIKDGWRERVGCNNNLGALLDMPGDLSEKIPKGRKHL